MRITFLECGASPRPTGGARVLSRLVAFLLLCIGVQIIASGAESLVAKFMAAHHG